MNLGTEDGGGLTRVGERGFFMVGTHVGHDCHVGDDVILANNAVLGGHVTLGNRVVLGGASAIHQFVRIGESAMVSGVSGVGAAIIPFGFAIGQRDVLDGLNVVGLRRRGLTRDDIRRLRDAYRALFLGPGVFRERLARVEREFAGDAPPELLQSPPQTGLLSLSQGKETRYLISGIPAWALLCAEGFEAARASERMVGYLGFLLLYQALCSVASRRSR
jgi:UDP-N-acetylglucosamine acyltransferase